LGENPLAPWPVALYGAVLLFAGSAYVILTRVLIAHQGADSILAKSIGRDQKGKLSTLGFLVSIPLAFVHPLMACVCYSLVAIVWLIPDRRIERAIGSTPGGG